MLLNIKKSLHLFIVCLILRSGSLRHILPLTYLFISAPPTHSEIYEAAPEHSSQNWHFLASKMSILGGAHLHSHITQCYIYNHFHGFCVTPMKKKTCPRHNGPKALSTLTQSTLLVQALKSWSNFGYIVNELQVSIFISQSHISQVSTKSVSQSQGKVRQ